MNTYFYYYLPNLVEKDEKENLMKLTFINTIALSFILMLNLGASKSHASLIYDFDISDTSWATYVVGDFTNTSVYFEFLGTTDFNNVTLSDVILFGYNVNGTIYETSAFWPSYNVHLLFNQTSTHVNLTVGAGIDALLQGTSAAGNVLHVGGGRQVDIYNATGAGFAMQLDNNSANKSFQGTLRASVPEPSTLAIFALGIFGLAARRMKKQS